MEAISLHFLVKVLIIFSAIYIVLVTKAIFKRYDKKLLLKGYELDLDKYKHDSTVDIDNKIDEKLDTLIEQCFEEYTILNLAFKSDYYIVEKDEEKICKEVCSLVATRISNALQTQLSLFYNDEAILDIVAKRVYFKVTNYVIEHNNNTGI